jgi:hypothetical protein
MPKEYKILSCDEEPSYRYRLDVSTLIQSSRELAIVQLNPSTANGEKSDPTIGKVSKWAKQNRFGNVRFLNLFAFRAPDPDQLIGKPYEILVGPRNDAVSQVVLRSADTIVVAWGQVNDAIDSHYKRRLSSLNQLLGAKQIHAVGEPVAGTYPRHGLMWNGNNRTLRPFEWSV